MQRIQLVEHENTSGETKEILDGIKALRGKIHNLHKVIANSLPALHAYTDLLGDLDKGLLPMPLRNQVAVLIAELHRSEYAVAAFTMICKLVGVSEADTLAARAGSSEDPKTDAALKFAKAMFAKRGSVSDAELQAVRDAGFNDSEIIELVSNIVTYTFMNYIAQVSNMEIDFPKIELLPQ